MESIVRIRTAINYLLIINLLNIVDLSLTLYIVQYPINELNLLLRWFWENGTGTFVAAKLAMTGLATAIILFAASRASSKTTSFLEKALLVVIGIYSIVPIMHAIVALGG